MKPSTTRVAEVNAPAVARYKEMRAALLDVPAADRMMCEIVVTAQLALLGHEVAFKLHALRLFEIGVSRQQLEQVVLAGLGVTLVIPQAAQALEWIEQACEQRQKG
jgi:hypothetical protein